MHAAVRFCRAQLGLTTIPIGVRHDARIVLIRLNRRPRPSPSLVGSLRKERGMTMSIGSRPRAGLALVLAFVVAGCGLRFGGPNYGDTVDGIACDNGSNMTFVATIHVWLISGAQRLEPTGGVGSTGSACNYWLRTENDPGVIHIRSPHPVTPTLATFFSIWDLAIPQGSGNSGPFRDAAEHGEITVNGVAVHGGAAAVTLMDGETIELIAASPPAGTASPEL